MSRAFDAGYRVEPLDSSHSRTAFHSGAPDLDRYFQNQAGQDARRKVAAVFVLVAEPKQNAEVVGYYTLSAYTVKFDELPETASKKLPRNPLLPATLLGRLAIDNSHRGKKLGCFLLMDALYRSWRNTAEVASVGVVVEALDEAARTFYLRHEFIQLQDHSNKLFIAMATVEKAFK